MKATKNTNTIEEEEEVDTEETSGSKDSGTEEFIVSGDMLLQKIKELISKGNTRKIIIKNSEGNSIMEFSLTTGVAVGALGAVFMPILIAVGAIAAVMTKCTIVVLKK